MHSRLLIPFLGVVALLMTLALVATLSLGRAGSAHACTINADYDPVSAHDTIIYGRIIEVSEQVPPELADQAGQYRTVTYDVYRVLKGDPQPSRLSVLVRVDPPGVPVMCWRLTADSIAGRPMVAGLVPSTVGLPITGFMSLWFEDEPWTQFPGQWRLARFIHPEIAEPETGPGITVIYYPTNVIDAVINENEGITWAQRFQRLRVWADDQLCGTWSLTDLASRDPNNDAFFVLGRSGQPAACSTPGARICMDREAIGQSGPFVLNRKFVLERGRNMFIMGVGPDTPHDPTTCVASVQGPASPLPPSVGTGLASSHGGPATWVGILVLLSLPVALARRRH